MAAPACFRARPRAALLFAGLLLFGGEAQAQILPWEVTVAEIEAGRLRNLIERLDKEYVLYQLRLGKVGKSDLIETATRIDGVIASLERGSPSSSIPPPWTVSIREQVERVDRLWGALRRIAVASPYDHLRVAREFMTPEVRRGDPLLIRYFDDRSTELVAESEVLIAAYHEECTKTEMEICPTAQTSGYAAMVIERATKEAVFIAAGIDPEQNRERLKETIAAYRAVRAANDGSEFFVAALDPERGASAAAAAELLASLREDWDAMQSEFSMLAAGDERNFDLERLLSIENRMVGKVERFTAALIRYASLAYGS